MKRAMVIRWVVIGLMTLLPVARAANSDFRTNINPALLYFQAFQNMPLPQFSVEDSNYFWQWSGGAWPEEPFDARRIGLIKQFDSSFKLIRRARFAAAPCDWGYDLTDGPEALLPGLAPAKQLAQVSRMRAMLALEHGDFDTARDDLIAAYTLGRQLSRDGILISCLVQFAIENILSSVLMENYYRFSADQLDALVSGMDAAPARGTIAATIGATERDAFYGYIDRKVRGLILASNGDENTFWVEFTSFWNPIATESEPNAHPDPTVDQVRAAAGGTAAGVLRLLEEMPDLYVEVARILALPFPEFQAQAPAFFAKIAGSPNPFVRHFFTVFSTGRVRAKEFAATVRQQTLRAAAAYKRGGVKALQEVKDPLTGDEFEFSRVQLEGVDRGFSLRCKAQFRDFPEIMIFLEKPGRHFHLDGIHAGTAY